MSRLWSERLCIAVLPDRLAWVILARGLGGRIRARGSVPISVAEDGSAWQVVLGILMRELPNIPITRGTVTVVLSNIFVRYLVVDSSAPLSGAEERLALARHDFHKLHGSIADSWEIRIAAGEGNYLAAGIDVELLAQLRQCFAATKLKLRSIQPYAVAAINHWAKYFDDKVVQGLFLVEPSGYCYVGMSEGKWEFFRCGRWEGDLAENYQRVQQREALRSGIENRNVWLVSAREDIATQELARQKSVQVLPMDAALRDVQQVEYLMAVLGTR